MKLFVPALLVAIALACAMAVVTHAYGPHSTPGIRILIVGLPGSLFGVWAGLMFGENQFLFYAVTALVNSVCYFFVLKGLLFLKRSLSKSTAKRSPN
jgi:hypothetical protein